MSLATTVSLSLINRKHQKLYCMIPGTMQGNMKMFFLQRRLLMCYLKMNPANTLLQKSLQSLRIISGLKHRC